MSLLTLCPSESLGTGDLVPVKAGAASRALALQVDSLRTLVYGALFTDARATLEQLPLGADGLPDTSYWGGYWGDILASAQGSNGSLLWTLRREKNIIATWLRAKDYVQQALAPLIDAGYAASFAIDTGFHFDRAMYINVTAVTASKQKISMNEEFAFNA